MPLITQRLINVKYSHYLHVPSVLLSFGTHTHTHTIIIASVNKASELVHINYIYLNLLNKDIFAFKVIREIGAYPYLNIIASRS